MVAAITSGTNQKSFDQIANVTCTQGEVSYFFLVNLSFSMQQQILHKNIALCEMNLDTTEKYLVLSRN